MYLEAREAWTIDDLRGAVRRKLAAQNLGLTSSAALVFVLGPADDEKLGYLIKELETASGKRELSVC